MLAHAILQIQFAASPYEELVGVLVMSSKLSARPGVPLVPPTCLISRGLFHALQGKGGCRTNSKFLWVVIPI